MGGSSEYNRGYKIPLSSINDRMNIIIIHIQIDESGTRSMATNYQANNYYIEAFSCHCNIYSSVLYVTHRYKTSARRRMGE